MKKKKKSIEKTIRNIFIALVIILIFFGIFIVKSYMGRAEKYYTFTGPNGPYKFEKVKMENITFHVATVYVEKDNKVIEYRVNLRNGPYEVEDIPMEKNIKEKILKSWIYLSQDPDMPNITEGRSTLALFEIGKITGTGMYGIFDINTKMAVTRTTNKSAELNMPTRNCYNATEEISVIEVRIANTTRIYSQNECVVIEARNSNELVMATDKLTLHLLGVF